MVVKKLKGAVSRAKNVGAAANRALTKYPSLAMVPYVPGAVSAANTVVGAADTLVDLMSSFGIGGVTHPQLANGQLAGVANNIIVRRSQPKFRGSTGTIRITHKELVSSVLNATGTDVGFTDRLATGDSAYKVNPSCSNFLPWLSKIAGNYDCYRFKRLKLVYVPMCSTATSGRVMLGYDPDSHDRIHVDRQALSSYSCSAEASVWGVTELECRLIDNSKWYYSSDISTNSGVSALLDQGQVFAATWGGANTDVVGEIYALYDIELKDPQPSASDVFQAYGGNGTQAIVVNFPAGASQTMIAHGDATSIRCLFNSPGTFWVSFRIACTATANLVSSTNAALGAAWYSYDPVLGQTTAFCNVTTFSSSAYVQVGGLANVGHWTVYSGASDQFTVTTY